MTSENFCYWLQGLLELDPSCDKLDAKQVKMLREHLAYVFEKPAPQIPYKPEPMGAVPGYSLIQHSGVQGQFGVGGSITSAIC